MSAGRTLQGVQVLRAAAALLVVAYHTVETYNARVANPRVEAWQNGQAGVDVFFVISGLVMVLSSDRLRDRADGWRVFLGRRFERIIPLYWLATAAKIALVASLPSLVLRSRLDRSYIVQSLLMVPVRDVNGDILPILPVGWTLSFEMMFYALCALALALKVPLLKFVTPVLSLLALVSFARTSAWPAVGVLSNTIVLEFAVGVWIGTMVLHGRVVSPGVGAILMIASFAVILVVPSYSASFQLVTWGLPAAFLVVGAVGIERTMARVPRWVLLLGDASYAIYLTHVFIMPVIGTTVAWLGLSGGLAVAATVAVGLAASALFGVAVHRAVEQPLMTLLRRRRALGVGEAV
jgi:peptidoglycan/LPS O-acetylase OafA/YrhL